ncbi:HSP20-like chaperone [Xylariaceae sp. FL1651]|nr:HSP20-like chaperone [Xylariaceae sp. FL1651]
MSVFTHHPFYTVNNNSLGNFGSLVRFIDDWDKHFSQEDSRSGQSQPRNARRSVQTFTPRFDVKETENTYELHGELPGVDKKNVHIEFSDPQTIVVRGHVERTHTAGTPPAGFLENKPEEQMSGAISNAPAEDDTVLVDSEAHETGSNKSFQPTVEDDTEGANKNSTAQPTPATTVAETAKPGAPTGKTETATQQKSKYWVYERSVGNFQRSFTFSSRVDHEGVSASLNNGILTVIVPKAKKHESRRIAIN